MKDLYLRLGLTPDAGEAEISASESTDKHASDYRGILLDPQRRDAYDRTFAIVKAIGILRSRLALDSGPSWFRDHCADFVPALRAQRLAEREAQAAAESEQLAARLRPVTIVEPAKARRWWPWVLLLLAAVAAIAVLFRTGG